jgi:hypothetical protein
MTWNPYNLDRAAQELVLKYRDSEKVLNESHKMRTTVAYGLERFWGEHLRLIDKNDATDGQKGRYWRDVWQKFVDILEDAGLRVPRGKINPQDKPEAQTKAIQAIAREFWNQETFPLEDQRIALYVLTQLCDSLVWWTQRYKKPSSNPQNPNIEEEE